MRAQQDESERGGKEGDEGKGCSRRREIPQQDQKKEERIRKRRTGCDVSSKGWELETRIVGGVEDPW